MSLIKLQKILALLLGGFVFFTAATGPFDSLIQRAMFLALVVSLGFTLYPLGVDKNWRPIGIVIDIILTAMTFVACGFIVVNYEQIMTTLPWAKTTEILLTIGLVGSVLELGRRTVGLIFPILVLIGIAYALFGNLLPGALRHRGFDIDFVTETIFLGDLGIWGMLTGIAATIIAAFVLFGSLLLHSGGGQSFMDLATKLGGKQPGGAAKIATIVSGMFGMISGSAVANVATTGNFTIPMMIRLRYPRAFAAAVEAVASTGGQIAPPIMGAAAFVMAEILGISYTTIIFAAIIPAALFYLSVFMTVHMVSIKQNLAVVPEDEIPAWHKIIAFRRIAPIIAALGGLGFGIYLGRSIATSAFYGIVGLLIAYLVTQFGQVSNKKLISNLVEGIADAGKGMVIIGVLLAGAQILVSMINLTGVGVALSSFIVSFAGNSAILVSVVVGLVCLIMGMGLPTTAAYVLVAAVLAPAMTIVGFDPLATHLFVFYFATISVITPPVCVAVFVAAGIAKTNWMPVAFEAVRLGAVTYTVPFLLLLYPGMTMQGGALAILEAVAAGLTLVIVIPALLSGIELTGRRLIDIGIYMLIIILVLIPHPATKLLAAIILIAGWYFRPTKILAKENT
ncbi:MAG: C4-dicarboxylate ABC transporter permease [Hyphomicrobiales bacterium]|nr:MAG: C4-dicarboxylate ABC transporter permease [Hyphomicrobiales bacterium]